MKMKDRPWTGLAHVVACAMVFGCTPPQRPLTAQAPAQVIVGVDDRRDWYELDPVTEARERDLIAKSTVVIVPNAVWDQIWITGPNGTGHADFSLAPTAAQREGLCSTEKNANAPDIAICSGVLIGDDKIMTHSTACPGLEEACLNNPNREFKIIFGYYRTASDTIAPVTERNVFTCAGKGMALFPFSTTIYKLDRMATGSGQFVPARLSGQAPPRGVDFPVYKIGSADGGPVVLNYSTASYSESQTAYLALFDSSFSDQGAGVFSEGKLTGMLTKIPSAEYTTTPAGCKTRVIAEYKSTFRSTIDHLQYYCNANYGPGETDEICSQFVLDADLDGVPNSEDACPCDPSESDPYVDGDMDGFCNSCMDGKFCNAACRGMTMDTCYGYQDLGTNCNYIPEKAYYDPDAHDWNDLFIDDACDPAVCFQATPIFNEVVSTESSRGAWGVETITTTHVSDVAFNKVIKPPKARDDEFDGKRHSAARVAYRWCNDEWAFANGFDFLCDAPKGVTPKHLTKSLGDTPWHRISSDLGDPTTNNDDKTYEATSLYPIYNDKPVPLHYSRKWDRDLDFQRLGITDDMDWPAAQRAWFWTYVDTQIGVEYGSLPGWGRHQDPADHGMTSNYIQVPPSQTYTLRTWDPDLPFKACIMPICANCPFVYNQIDESRILTAFDDKHIGWLRTGGIDPKDISISEVLRERFMKYSWVGSSDAVPQAGLGAAMPMAVAYSTIGAPAILDFIWADGRLLSQIDIVENPESPLSVHVFGLGLQALPPALEGPEKMEPIVLYSSTRAQVMYVGGYPRDGIARSQEIAVYNLISQTWATLSTELLMGDVLSAAYDTRHHTIWIVDQVQNVRLIKWSLKTNVATVVAAKKGLAGRTSYYMSVDSEGNLLFLCSGKQNVLSKMNYEAEVSRAWLLEQAPLLPPVVQGKDTYLVLQRKDGVPILERLDGFMSKDEATSKPLECQYLLP